MAFRDQDSADSPEKVVERAAKERGRVTVEDQRVGHHLRAQREKHQLGLRELARRLGISASALSQIETDKSRPSMRTLFAIARELHVSLDELFGETGDAVTAETSRNPGVRTRTLGTPARSRPDGKHVQRGSARSSIDLESGVRWERLTPPHADHDIAFLYMIWDVGGSSSPDGSLMSHGGREYGLVLSGWLEVTVGQETYELGPGDSICFDSTVPHRVRNIGTEPVHGVWFGVGRRGDERLRALNASAAGGPGR